MRNKFYPFKRNERKELPFEFSYFERVLLKDYSPNIGSTRKKPHVKKNSRKRFYKSISN